MHWLHDSHRTLWFVFAFKVWTAVQLVALVAKCWPTFFLYMSWYQHAFVENRILCRSLSVPELVWSRLWYECESSLAGSPFHSMGWTGPYCCVGTIYVFTTWNIKVVAFWGSVIWMLSSNKVLGEHWHIDIYTPMQWTKMSWINHKNLLYVSSIRLF